MMQGTSEHASAYEDDDIDVIILGSPTTLHDGRGPSRAAEGQARTDSEPVLVSESGFPTRHLPAQEQQKQPGARSQPHLHELSQVSADLVHHLCD